MTETPDVTAEAFVLDSEEKVNWLLRKLANLDAEKKRIASQYQSMKTAIESEEKSLRWRFEADLKAFAAQKIAESKGRRKSVHLLQGTLSFRTVPATFRIENPTIVLAYAKQNALSSLWETQEILNTDATKAYIETTGELLPGVELLPEKETFSIRFGKSEE